MKGFIGSANIDTNSRLCMSSAVAGHKRAFGEDLVPVCYDDLETADLIVLVGSNTAWCHPVLFQRMLRNKRERGAKIVVIDPRRTMTAEDGDLFLSVVPGGDTALFSGLLVYLAQTGALDQAYIDRHCIGFDDALARAKEIAPDAAATAAATGLDEGDVARFFELFRSNRNVVTCFSQGVNQSAQGTDKVNAIVNCHLATGRIGRPGMGPFSLTGQPNAMGGREVGGEQVADLRVRHAPLSAIEVPPDLAPSMIDEYPVAFVAAALAQGRSVFRGLEELRVKESDRIATMAEGLRAIGARVEEMEDGLIIEGTGGQLLPGGGPIATKLDHRIAMSFAIAGALLWRCEI